MSIQSDLTDVKQRIIAVQTLLQAIQASVDFYIFVKAVEPTPSSGLATPRDNVLAAIATINDELSKIAKRIMDGVDTGIP